MDIESVIKSNSALSLSKKTILNILYTQNLIADRFNALLKPYDLSSEQFNVLRILRGQNGAKANMCLIQDRMVAKTSNTTRLVDKLLAKEFVTREICPNNRRKMEIGITEKGLQLLTLLDPKVIAHERTFSDNLSEADLHALNDLLEKFRNQQ